MPGKCLRAELLNHILLKCFGSILAYLRFMAKLVFFSLNEFAAILGALPSRNMSPAFIDLANRGFIINSQAQLPAKSLS